MRRDFLAYRNRIPEGFVPIAGTSGGDVYVLRFRGLGVGEVYVWEHEFEADPDRGQVPSLENMRLAAPTFSGFLDALHPMGEGE